MAPSKRKALPLSPTTKSKSKASSSQQPIIPMEVQNPIHDETSDDHSSDSGAKRPTMLISHTKKAILEAIKHKQVKASARQKSVSEDSNEESESSEEDDCDEEKLNEIVKGVCSGIKTKQPALEEPNEYEEEPIPTSENESSDDETSDSQIKQSPKKAILESKEVSDQESESSEDDSDENDSDDEKQCAMVKVVSCGVKRKEPAVSVGPSLQKQTNVTNKEAVDTKIEKHKRLKLELEQMRTQLVKKQCEDLVKSFSMK